MSEVKYKTAQQTVRNIVHFAYCKYVRGVVHYNQKGQGKADERSGNAYQERDVRAGTDNGTWYTMFRYTDWKGERKQKCKRGFPTRAKALEWEREFLQQKQADVDMTFSSFAELYEKDIRPRLKENTWLTKDNIIKNKTLPYFAKRKLSEITAKDIIDWQNEIRRTKDRHGNHWMGEQSGHCICALMYPRSGTGQTVRYAKEREVWVVNVAE